MNPIHLMKSEVVTQMEFCGYRAVDSSSEILFETEEEAVEEAIYLIESKRQLGLVTCPEFCIEKVSSATYKVVI